MALTAANGYFAAGALAPELAEPLQRLAPDWLAEMPAYLGVAGRAVDILETAAVLAGVLLEGDYARATLAMRELTAEEALARLAREARAGSLPGAEGLQPANPSGTTGERLAEALARREAALFDQLGFEPAAAEVQGQRARRETPRVARILAGGDLHDRFWHWLDRFYYEFYQPWRRTRTETLAQAEQRARVVLGNGPAGADPPPLDWLPGQNPVLRYPELRAAVAAGRVRVFFWVEPFGLPDTWAIYRPAGQQGTPVLLLAFAEPGELYENFRAAAADLARRAAALGDPTRLIILRVIRNFSMINTEIADFLGLSRPTVSVHAKILREAGLIRSRQEGREVRHEIAAEEVRRLFQDLEHFLDLP